MNVQEVDREVERRVGERLLDHLLRKTRLPKNLDYSQITWEALVDDMIELSHWEVHPTTNQIILRPECFDMYIRTVDPDTFKPMIRRKA